MNVIIFSKDRAAQLDLLLRSMVWLIADKYVIYACSTKQHNMGYDKLFWDYWGDRSDIHLFMQEDNFKDSLLKQVDVEQAGTVFFTDDDVFMRNWPFVTFPFPDNVACLSLRLNPRMGYCYTLNRKQTPPKMHPGNVWNWRLADADYGYPMSLDGHIFRTSDILPLLEKLDYHDPNSLEAALARNPINRPMMMCFDKSVIVNNPINRVQDTIKNRHGNVSAEWLNEQFLAGRRIKLEPFIGIEPNACHVELPIEWE